MGMGWGLSSSSDIIIHEFGEKVKFSRMKIGLKKLVHGTKKLLRGTFFPGTAIFHR